MAYNSLQDIIDTCTNHNISFWKVILLDDMNERSVTKEESIQMMEKMWQAMRNASQKYDGTLLSHSGLVGKMGAQMEEYRQNQVPLCGDFMSKVITQALQMGESNACSVFIFRVGCSIWPCQIYGRLSDSFPSAGRQ